MKLYHYVHCPFCIRVRMALGFLEIPYESVVLDYHDEKTPLSLTSVKMLPIMTIDGENMNESLDIIRKLDSKNLLGINAVIKTSLFNEVEELLSALGSDIHSLAMPHWIYTKEFNETSRNYFQKKKEVKRGPFKKLIQRKKDFVASLAPKLLKLEKMLKNGHITGEFSVMDILIASHLWGLYIVPEFQFSVKLHNYLQNIAELTRFDYHKDLWR